MADTQLEVIRAISKLLFAGQSRRTVVGGYKKKYRRYKKRWVPRAQYLRQKNKSSYKRRWRN